MNTSFIKIIIKEDKELNKSILFIFYFFRHIVILELLITFIINNFYKNYWYSILK